MLTNAQMELLKILAQKVLTTVDFKDVGDIKIVQALTKLGYARDYGDQWGRRIPIRLRIWGITGAGRAVLEQQHLTESQRRQPSFTLLKKPGLTIKRCAVGRHTEIRGKKSERANSSKNSKPE